MVLYLARRYLGMSQQEWDALPWYMARTYIEGFNEDGILDDGKKGHSGASSRMDLTSGSAPANFKHRRVVAAG